MSWVYRRPVDRRQYNLPIVLYPAPVSGDTVTATMTGKGTATLSLFIQYARAFSATGVGTPALTKGIGKSFSITGVGTSALQKGIAKTSLDSTGTGTAAFAESKGTAQTASATGVGVLTSIQTFAAATGSAVAKVFRQLLTQVNKWF